MYIETINVYVLRSDRLCEPFGYSQMWYDDRGSCVVQVITNEGIEGWGEAFGPAELNAAVIEKGLAPMILGSDPFDVEVIWQSLYNRYRDYGQKGIIICGMSALDIALWDIMGKAVDLPVCRLLGGVFRREFPAYATGLYFSPDFSLNKLIKEAQGYLDAGFRSIKMKIGYHPREDIQFVQAVREAIGYDCQLMVDANHAYNAQTAIELGRRLEEYQVSWFEEPVPPEDIEGYIEVKHALDMAVAGGEGEYTRYGFKNLICRRAVDIVQPDTCCAGGLTEARKLVTLANTHGIQYNPHVWGTGIALYCGMHLIASIPDNPPSINPLPPMLEYDQTPNPLRENITMELPEVNKGLVSVPLDRAGLGITIDQEALARYAVAKSVVKA
ncbi:MAG: mandelate racemase/muconate lactonizing enzyme family protein [Firmicutes bacterium]|nr:mandelate racemase/muconate lactonizing enzyme family protein [Bacillota bacterium]